MSIKNIFRRTRTAAAPTKATVTRVRTAVTERVPAVHFAGTSYRSGVVTVEDTDAEFARITAPMADHLSDAAMAAQLADAAAAAAAVLEEGEIRAFLLLIVAEQREYLAKIAPAQVPAGNTEVPRYTFNARRLEARKVLADAGVRVVPARKFRRTRKAVRTAVRGVGHLLGLVGKTVKLAVKLAVKIFRAIVTIIVTIVGAIGTALLALVLIVKFFGDKDNRTAVVLAV